MNININTLIATVAIFLVTTFCLSSALTSLNGWIDHKRLDKIESYLIHHHGYDASKALGFYKPLDGSKD